MRKQRRIYKMVTKKWTIKPKKFDTTFLRPMGAQALTEYPDACVRRAAAPKQPLRYSFFYLLYNV